MKKKLLYSGFLVMVFLISVVAHIPASLVMNQLSSSEVMRVTGVDGTVWSGSAQQLFWQGQNVGDLSWDIQVSQLLMAKFEVAVRFGRGSDMGVRGKGNLGLGFAGPYADKVVVSVAANKLATLFPLPVPVTFQGQVELSLNHYRYDSPWCESAEGSLAWTHGRVDSPLGELSLGPVVADLQCQSNQMTLNGQQNSDQMSSEFALQLQPDMSYSAKAWFKPEAQFPPEMAEQLQWIGAPDNQGKYQFNYQGQL
ncbi:MAG: type II secretion system protein N [Vibrio anguillarum]